MKREVRASQPKRTLTEVISRLHVHYGEPESPLPTNALEFVIYENVSYLVNETRQAVAFLKLKKEIGTTADAIANVSDSKLRPIIDAPGNMRDTKFKALRVIARTVIDDFDSNLDAACDQPTDAALKVLQQFPSIGLPGAERILLLTGRASILALDSNGLRVLCRLGYSPELKDYNQMYRAVRDALATEIPADIKQVQRAHLLLRLHGKTLCKRSAPQCGSCPLQNICDFGRLA